MHADENTVQAPPRPCINWTRWSPVGVHNRPHRWCLIRFEGQAGDGQPLGKAIYAKTPDGQVRTFPSESLAKAAGDELSRQEGL